MQAIQLHTKGVSAHLVQDRPIPARSTLPLDCLLIKTAAVALNPHELLDIYPPYSISSPGDLLGCDYAGTIVAIGSSVKRHFKIGERVCGCTRPNPLQPDWGAFAGYIVVVADVQLRVPESWSWEDAAGLGVSVLTSGAVLYDTLKFPMPPLGDVSRRQILIYGGSTSTGRTMLQFAKLSNFEIATTCSPANFSLVKALGADHVFDYNDLSTSIAAIRTLTKDSLSLCIDCYSTQASYEFCSQTLSPSATYVHISPITPSRPDLDCKMCMGVLYFNVPFLILGQTYNPPEGAFESAVRFAEVAEKLLAEGKIKPHPTDVRRDGLAGVLAGVQEMREGRVRGKKIVYSLE